VKKRGLQERLLITFSLIVTFVIILFSILFLTYTLGEWNRQIETDLNATAERMSQQLDTIVSTMDYAAVDLISQADLIPSLSVLTHFDRTDKKNIKTINEAKFFLEKSLYKYSLMRDFYRISIYTSGHDFFTNRLAKTYDYEGIENWFSGNEYLRQAENRSGKFLLIPPHEDVWVGDDPAEVFSLVRSVIGFSKGETTGYIEIQQEMDIIKQIAQQPAEQYVCVTISTSNGNLLYENNPGTAGRKAYTVEYLSDYTGIIISLARPKLLAMKSLIGLFLLFFLLTIAILFISLMTIRYFTKQITQPVQNLIEYINSMDFESLDFAWESDSKQDEIEAMSSAFTHLKDRLQESVNKEIVLQTLQLQAKFDSLQAQVNPHFLFNVLNVISSRGLESGNEEICEICDDIASLLRYSSSTTDTRALVPEEIEHVRNYLKLIKKRYEHKVSFSIDIDTDTFCSVFIPKIVLQPLVENSINHNLGKGISDIEISIHGICYDNGYWYLEITDNGCGIPFDRLASLREELKGIRYQLDHETAPIRLNFGGLGVVNTFARLYLFYGSSLDFTIESKNGVTIRIEYRGDNA
jgi:two-component system sensor histidine kinase YesM